MSKKIVIIQSSARTDGDSALVSKYIHDKYQFDTIDLKSLNIQAFDYDNNNADDDFMPTINKLIKDYNYWIFITPVYWYSISGRLKVFFDRISDLLKWHKDTGRLIKGKNMALISVSNDDDVHEHFDIPINLSAEYLSMNYHGHLHCAINDSELSEKYKEKIGQYLEAIIKD